MCELLGVDYLSDPIDLILWYFTLISFFEYFPSFWFPILHNSDVEENKKFNNFNFHVKILKGHSNNGYPTISNGSEIENHGEGIW